MGRDIRTKCTSKSSDNCNLSAFSFPAMLDISMMYSLMFSMFVYFMPTSFLKRVLVSAFSFLAKIALYQEEIS